MKTPTNLNTPEFSGFATFSIVLAQVTSAIYFILFTIAMFRELSDGKGVLEVGPMIISLGLFFTFGRIQSLTKPEPENAAEDFEELEEYRGRGETDET